MWIIRAVSAMDGLMYVTTFTPHRQFTKDKNAAYRFGSEAAAQLIADRVWKSTTFCVDIEEVNPSDADGK